MVTSDTALFSERLWPGASVWVMTVFFAVGVGLTILPASLPIAVGAAAAVLLVGAVLVRLTAPLVRVVAGELQAGRARIPVHLLGEPEVLDATATRAALGPDLDVRAHLCLRAWARTAVRLPVTDPRDPTPYWFVSSRRPAELASAVRTAQAAHRSASRTSD